MTPRKQTILVRHGTGTPINPLETAEVSVPAAPWADGTPISADARLETAPARGVMSFSAPKPPTQAELFIAALREELRMFRQERDA